MKVTAVFKSFPGTFWMANAMELLERWAWYGFYILFALYLTSSTDTGGLGFSQTEKGLMMGIGTAILYFLPLLTGAVADRIGYRKTLYIAYTVYTLAFLLMPRFSSFAAVFVIYLFLAVGAALFKPIISATVAKTTNEETSSIGFGIFYMMVNIGAFIGPFVTSYFKKFSWDYVFYSSALVIAANFILLTFFFKEPVKNQNSQSLPLGKQIQKIFSNIWEAVRDWRFFLFLLIVSGFWTMYNQFFMTLPVFIEQWGNTSVVYSFLAQTWPWLAHKLGTAEGTIPAELMINVDAGFIILFQILISSIVMRFQPLRVMITGIVTASVGMGLSLATQNGMFMIVAIFIFSIGEMSTSPKITEYIGRIAPSDKTALYMGCSFIPVAIGFLFAGVVSGNVYQALSDKITLAQTEAIARGIDIPQISQSFSQNDLLQHIATKMNMNTLQLTQFLWDKYHPSSIWIVVTGIGLVAATSLMIYDKFIMNKK